MTLAETTTTAMPAVSAQQSPEREEPASSTGAPAASPACNNATAVSVSSAIPGLDSSPTPKRLPLHQIYAQPAPIRTFPLPAFYPHIPVSWLHLAYAWLSQAFSPPPKEPSVVHRGVWHPETRSVHITDADSMRALWREGFYGKGNLSRSEPSWYQREQARRLAASGQSSQPRDTASEVVTNKRRQGRRNAKWERARTELEAIEKTRLEETGVPLAPPAIPVTVGIGNSISNGLQEGSTNHVSYERTRELKAPVGPQELLALPNSLVELLAMALPADTAGEAPSGSMLDAPTSAIVNGTPQAHVPKAPAPGPSLLVNGRESALDDPETPTNGFYQHTGNLGVHQTPTKKQSGGLNRASASSIVSTSPGVNGSPKTPSRSEAEAPMKRRKSVRFSPRVESTTFLDSDPPSPHHSATVSKVTSASPLLEARATGNGAPVEAKAPIATSTISSVPAKEATAGNTENKEHLQLSPEEAFFLAFGFGALTVLDPVTQEPIPTSRLLSLFRAHSYFPPKTAEGGVLSREELQPYDPFLIHYIVYHHFRSLGWVPRHGIKFGVDWLLYKRGPAMDHSWFGVVVIPSFSDSRWKDYEHQQSTKSWAWMMGVMRALSHVQKHLVFVYVDIPPPPAFGAALDDPRSGIAAAFKLYKIREVMARRWSGNRNR